MSQSRAGRTAEPVGCGRFHPGGRRSWVKDQKKKKKEKEKEKKEIWNHVGFRDDMCGDVEGEGEGGEQQQRGGEEGGEERGRRGRGRRRHFVILQKKVK